jgi:ABC-type transporter Mla maintaining outer membrane lipid asymmetry ATPase subunit MlaF
MKPLSQVESIESIEFRNASFSYEGGGSIFDSISIELPLDQNILVTGSAGQGQSTFIKLLALLVQPTQGSLLFNGLDTSQMSFEEFLPFRRRMSYTFDYGGLFANRTLAENLMLPILYHKILSFEEAERAVQKFADDFGFDNVLNNRPSNVSSGLRKLICILRSFILRPQLLVMDDPFTGVDSESCRRLLHLIEERREQGELRHIFLTSRDEVWPQRMNCSEIVIENRRPHFCPRKKVAA